MQNNNGHISLVNPTDIKDVGWNIRLLYIDHMTYFFV